MSENFHKYTTKYLPHIIIFILYRYLKMHTTTEIHAATKVAQQMAKKKKEKKKDEHKELGTNIHLKELNET